MFVPKLTIFFLLALPMINASCPQSVRVKYEPGHQGGAYSKISSNYGCYHQGGDVNRHAAWFKGSRSSGHAIWWDDDNNDWSIGDAVDVGGTVKRAAAPGGGADYAQLMQDIIGDTMIGKASSRLLEALQLLADANAIR